jgi:two-component system, NarL family, nitrate/nitrite sensor histidine kinase NarX
VLVGEPPADAERDREILRIAQEALQNVLKHAKAQHVVVTLRRDAEGTLLEVKDDGIGFDPEAPGTRSRRLGLT